MLRNYSLVVVLSTLVLATVYASSEGTVPLFILGGKNAVRSNIVLSTTTSSDKLSQALSASITKISPALSVTIVQPQLTSTSALRSLGAYGDTPALPNLRSLLPKRSIIAPYVTVAGSMEKDVARLFHMPAPPAPTTFTTCADLEKMITEQPHTVINVDALSSIDSCLPSLDDKLNALSGGKYILAITASSTGLPSVIFAEFETDIQHQVDVQAFVTADTSATLSSSSSSSSSTGTSVGDAPPIGVTKVNGEIISGLVIGLFLIITALIGFNCAMDIKTPARFATPAMVLPATKEY